MDTSMYYTFSTIAQVLAGFIALSGVFLVFKIQELRKMQLSQVHNFINQVERMPIAGIKIQIYNCPLVSKDLVNLHRSEDLTGMKEEMEKILNDEVVLKEPIRTDIQRIPDLFETLKTKRNRLMLFGKISMVIGVISIIYSIIIIPFIPYIADHLCLRIPIIYRGILLAVLSIVSMMITIFYALSSDYKISKPTQP